MLMVETYLHVKGTYQHEAANEAPNYAARKRVNSRANSDRRDVLDVAKHEMNPRLRVDPTARIRIQYIFVF